MTGGGGTEPSNEYGGGVAVAVVGGVVVVASGIEVVVVTAVLRLVVGDASADVSLLARPQAVRVTARRSAAGMRVTSEG